MKFGFANLFLPLCFYFYSTRVASALAGRSPEIGPQLWDLAPDGKRLALIAPAEAVEGPRQEHTLVYLQNVFDELRRRVPEGK